MFNGFSQFKYLCFLTFTYTAIAHSETYDWLRSSVNEFWYNQFVGDCSKMVTPINLNNLYLSAPLSCARASDSVHLNRALGKDLVSDAYFDEALIELTKQNQCQFDYWSALSTQNSNSYDAQTKANKKLGGQFEKLNRELKNNSFADRKIVLPTTDSGSPTEQAEKAQKKIVDQLVEAAYKIAKKERELKHYLAQNPVFTPDPKKSSGPQVNKMAAEIEMLERSYPFSEDQEVTNFVKGDIISRIHDDFKLGKEPNLEEIKKYFSANDSNGFQARVVNKKLESISKNQQDYADIDGKYNDNYSFKVNAVQSGVGAKILKEKVNQNSNFSHLQCEMDSKYGKGEKIGTTANTAIIAGVTMVLGGGPLLLGKLAQVGITSQRAVRIGQAISAVGNTSISASEMVYGLVYSCKQSHFKNLDSSVCERVNSVKETGIDVQINSEIDHSNCLADLGLAALSGAVAFKSAVAAKRLKRDQQLMELGFKSRFSDFADQVRNNASLTPTQKKQLIAEFDRSISLSNLDNFPRQEFLIALAKEDSADLLSALKQINNDTGGTTWREKVRTWISSKGFNKKEAQKLEACMVDNAAKTSKCTFIESQAKS